MIKFSNLEFIFAIGGLKIAGRDEEHRINMTQSKGLFFTITL